MKIEICCPTMGAAIESKDMVVKDKLQQDKDNLEWTMTLFVTFPVEEHKIQREIKVCPFGCKRKILVGVKK